MVDGKTIAYAVGGLFAAEATGLTNFSGGGSSRSAGIPTSVKQQLKGQSNALQQISEKVSQTQETAQSAKTLAQSSGDSGMNPATLAAILSASKPSRMPSAGTNSVSKTLKVIRDNTQATVESNTPGNGNSPTDRAKSEIEKRKNQLNVSNTEGDSFDLQDMRNTNQGTQVGDVFAAGGEIGHQSGQIVKDAEDALIGETNGGTPVIKPAYDMGKTVGKAWQEHGF